MGCNICQDCGNCKSSICSIHGWRCECVSLVNYYWLVSTEDGVIHRIGVKTESEARSFIEHVYPNAVNVVQIFGGSSIGLLKVDYKEVVTKKMVFK